MARSGVAARLGVDALRIRRRHFRRPAPRPRSSRFTGLSLRNRRSAPAARRYGIDGLDRRGVANELRWHLSPLLNVGLACVSLVHSVLPVERPAATPVLAGQVQPRATVSWLPRSRFEATARARETPWSVYWCMRADHALWCPRNADTSLFVRVDLRREATRATLRLAVRV